MKTLAFLLLLSGGVAVAEPRFEVIDRGTALEVIAHDIKAARTAITPARSRLEVDLVGYPRVPAVSPTDGSIKVVELDGANPRRLSVKLPLERAQVKTLSRFAQAIQVGDDLHLLFPREVPAEGARVVLPEPTLPKEIAAKLGPQPPVVGPTTDKPASATDPKTPDKPAAAVTKPEPTPEAPPTKAEPKHDDGKAFLAPEEQSSNFSLLAMGGLGTIALGLWMIKKRKSTQAGTPTTIDVVAQRSLGAKAKVVWLNAGGREMVVAVTPQQVRMLGQWKKSEGMSTGAAAPMPFAQALDNQRADKPRAAPASPVAGILKLRERASYEAVNEEVATGDLDADALWAKEIFAAGGRR